MDQNCGNCRFFITRDANKVAGECHRHAPTVLAGQWTSRPSFAAGGGAIINSIDNIAGQFPPVTSDIWCGDWDEHHLSTIQRRLDEKGADA